MTSKLKQLTNLLKLFLVIIIFSSCEKNEQETPSQQNHQVNEYSFDEIIKKPKFNKAYNLFNHKLNERKFAQKSNIPVKDIDFKIDSTTIKEISVDSITTYTMRITRPEESEDYFENLVVKVNKTDSINAYIIKYFPDKEMTFNKTHKSFGFDGTTETKEIIFNPEIFSQYLMETYHCDTFLLCDYGGTTHSAGYNCTQTYAVTFCSGGGGSTEVGSTGGTGTGGTTTTGGSGTLYTSVVYISEEEAWTKYNNFFTNLLPEQKEILQANNNEAGQQVFNFLWLNNFASSKKSFIKQLIDLSILDKSTFTLNKNLNTTNSMSFSNLNELHNYLNNNYDNNTYSNNVISDNGGERLVRVGINRMGILNTGISIDIKLKKQNNIWVFDSALSDEYATFSTLYQWEQGSVIQNSINDILTVEIFGKESLGVNIEGIGLAYTIKSKILVKINNLTGNIISVKMIKLTF